MKALFVDIGGVFLTNGWDHSERKEASKVFHFDYEEFENLHHLFFDPFESGFMSLDDYLDHVLFHKKRDFTKVQFKKYMFSLTKPFPEMIELIARLKEKYHLKVIAISNEARELNAHRLKKFKLTSFIDFFVSSCYVHMRKPDPRIWKLALDLSQVPPAQSLYIDDREPFVDMARSFRMHGLHHEGYSSTVKKLKDYGLTR
jgi:putative hydrolase of the HAD superfamily